MYPYFDVDGISVDKLLAEWRWLVKADVMLLAINSFGDLFLKDADGMIHRLDTSGGELIKIADSEVRFRNQVAGHTEQKEWFLIDQEMQAAQRGYVPKKGECVGAKIPWIFKESTSVPDNLCVIELYQYVSFMGDIFGQMQDVPDGGEVRLRVEPRPVS